MFVQKSDYLDSFFIYWFSDMAYCVPKLKITFLP